VHNRHIKDAVKNMTSELEQLLDINDEHQLAD
jgi:hypothetical protein